MKLAELFENEAPANWTSSKNSRYWPVVSMVKDGIKITAMRKADAHLNSLIKFSDKDTFLKKLLSYVKDSNHQYFVNELIKGSRAAGYDYPEFKAIEKSAGK